MDITPVISEGQQIIQSYGAGGFKVGGLEYMGSILVLGRQTLSWTPSRKLQINDFLPVFECNPKIEILLLGTGSTHAFVPPELRQALRERGIGLESMDTGAACRTYNVLLLEGRRVAAALMAL